MCVRSIHSSDTGRFDFVENLGAMVPMRTIGYLLGIPEENQEEIRDRGGANSPCTRARFRPVPQGLSRAQP